MINFILVTGEPGQKVRVSVFRKEKKYSCDLITRTLKVPFYVLKIDTDVASLNNMINQVKALDMEVISTEEAIFSIKKIKGKNFEVIKHIIEVG